jgi:hypothetical protein
MKTLAIAAGALALCAAAQAASAAPATFYGGRLIQADYVCGPGLHVNGWGRCVPNYYGGVYAYGWPYYHGGWWGGRGWYGRGWHGGWGHGGWGHGGWRGHR